MTLRSTLAQPCCEQTKALLGIPRQEIHPTSKHTLTFLNERFVPRVNGVAVRAAPSCSVCHFPTQTRIALAWF